MDLPLERRSKEKPCPMGPLSVDRREDPLADLHRSLTLGSSSSALTVGLAISQTVFVSYRGVLPQHLRNRYPEN